MGESENTDGATATLDDVVNLLERIAIALETMAGQKQPSEVQCDVEPKPPFRRDSNEYKRCLAWAEANGVPKGLGKHSLAQGGIMSFDDVTSERLTKLRLCGEKTINKLLEWAASKTGNKGTK